MTVSRRSLLQALPFFGVTAVAPVAQACAAEGAAIPLDVAEAIADWNRKSDATALAWQAWDERKDRAVYHGNSPLYAAWWDCREAADEALTVMLRALRESEIDLAHIYRRA